MVTEHLGKPFEDFWETFPFILRRYKVARKLARKLAATSTFVPWIRA